METVKVWIRPQDYAKISANKTPNEYWLTKPNFDAVEITVSATLVESWGKVNNKKILLG